MACGGGKNGSGSHANLAVATSHTVRNRPSASSHGARDCRPVPTRPSRRALSVANRMPPAITNAVTASPCVRDQSPRSSHHRQERPKTTHARLARTAGPFVKNRDGSRKGRPTNAAPSSTDCGSAAALDVTEYIEINALRKFCCIRAWLEDGYEFQIIRIGFQFQLEHRTYGMVMVGVVPDHSLQIFKGGGFRRVRLERYGRLVGILRDEHRGIEQGLDNSACDQRV